MAYTIVKSDDVWVSPIKDRPGALGDAMTTLAEAGVNLEFVLARRAPDKPGKGVVFAAPIKGAKQCAAAKKAGFHKSKSIKALRIDGPDKPGLGATITSALGEEGINLRGLSAVSIGKKCAINIAVDTPGCSTRAVHVIKKVLKIK